MSVMRRLTLLTLPLFVTACGAEETQATPQKAETMAVAAVQADEAAIKARFAKIGIEVDEIVASDINGLVEIRTAGGVLFASPNGEHFIAGTLYSRMKTVTTKTSLMSVRLQSMQKKSRSLAIA
ncbi:protein-disulfide isomerase [Vibrio mediterranei AK1]|nr:protein-disulfide isomerase [Vibrio mediterranei AK1]